MSELAKQIQISTIQMELERVFKVLENIEEKLFSPEPTMVKENPIDKILMVRNNITDIAERLERINNSLDYIGK
jgi:hypothetical protein